MLTKKILLGLTLGTGAILAFASTTACSVSVSVDCAGDLTNCNGECADTTSDPDNCGGCGVSCGSDECIDSACTQTSCVESGGGCTVDDDCCELFCQPSNSQCGCITDGDDTQFCNEDDDCCSGSCDRDTGYCTG